MTKVQSKELGCTSSTYKDKTRIQCETKLKEMMDRVRLTNIAAFNLICIKNRSRISFHKMNFLAVKLKLYV
jgi:hypothetical protein